MAIGRGDVARDLEEEMIGEIERLSAARPAGVAPLLDENGWIPEIKLGERALEYTQNRFMAHRIRRGFSAQPDDGESP